MTNPASQPPRLSVTVEDVRNFDFEGVLSREQVDPLGETMRRTCHKYEQVFTEAAQEFSQVGNEIAKSICGLFGYVCSFVLRLDTPRDPYVLGWARDIGINEPYAQLLLETVDNIPDAELRARVADVLWVLRKGDYRTAMLAIDSYLEAATQLHDPLHWVDCAQRVERALQLATQLDRNGEQFKKVVTLIEEWLDKYSGTDPLFLSHKLMDLLREYNQGDASKYTQLSEKIACRAEAEHDWHKARGHWDMKTLWHYRENEEPDARAARLKSAETYIYEAQDKINRNPTDYSGAVHDLKHAIHGMRQNGGTDKQIEHVREQLVAYQEKSIESFSLHSGSIDVTQCAKDAIARVKGKSLREAILVLAEMGGPMPETEIREQVEDMSKAYPFYFLVYTEQLNAEGQTVGIRTSAFSDDQKEIEGAIRAEMHRLSAQYQGLQASAQILPALRQITLEHHIRHADLFEVVHNNPFVEPERERYYVQGLYAGFHSDFLTASHLLIPQLEQSIRRFFSVRGAITTSMDEQGIENKKDLNSLLYIPQAQNVLGLNLLFTLRGLLVERFGSNLRNRFAHGLDTPILESEQAVYLWGLVLYLCCSHVLADMQIKETHPSDEGDQTQA